MKIIFNLFNDLNKVIKLKILLNIFFSYVIICIEIIGIVLISQLFYLIDSSKELSENRFYSFFEKIYSFFQLYNIDLLLGFSFLVFIFYIIKNILNLISTNNFYVISNKIVLFFTEKVITTFQNKPFIKIKKYSNSKLITLVNYDCFNVGVNLFIPLSIIIVESILVFSILLFLLFYDFTQTILIIIITSLIVILFQKISGKYIVLFAKEKKLNEEKKINSLEIMYNLYTEFKLANNFDFINNRLNIQNFKTLNYQKKVSVLQQTPRFFFEIILFGLFFIIILYASKIGDLENIIEKIGVYGLSAYKTLPSLIKISSNLQSIKFGNVSLENVINYIKSLDAKSHKKIQILDFEKFKFKNVSFIYDDRKILNDLSFEINKGDFFGIIGDSGKGKTTIINLLLGLLQPTTGEVIINNKKSNEILNNNLFSYVPQDINIFEGSFIENITFETKSIDSEIFKNSIQKSDLEDIINNYPNKENTIISQNSLSGGQKQRIGIARALYKKSRIILLDESTNSLDSTSEKKIISQLHTLRKEGTTIIMVSHKKNLFNHYNNFIEL